MSINMHVGSLVIINSSNLMHTVVGRQHIKIMTTFEICFENSMTVTCTNVNEIPIFLASFG